MDRAQRRRAWASVRDLAQKHGIRLRKAKSWGKSECHVPTRQAWVPPRMDDPISYLVALHELGHIAHPRARHIALTKHRQRTDRDSDVVEEALAWSWAFQHADPQLKNLLRARDYWTIGYLWASYLEDGPGSQRA